MRFKLFFWFWPDEPGRSARESVGSWLHGVTLRVTARARVVAIRRKIRDRQATLAAQSIAALVSDQTDMPTIERQEDAEIVHRELNRLPEKYRAPIVLCYLEGLTHDEAATQLCWPVGTVCSRLARARDTLRSRLARRGVTAQATFGPMASWIVGGSQEPIGAAATLSSETISRDLRASIVRTVTQLPGGRTATATAGSSTSLLLSQGVIKSMMFKKLLMVACALLPIALTALGGGVFLARKTLAQVQKPTAAASVPNVQRPTAKEMSQQGEINRLAQQLLEAVRPALRRPTCLL